MQCSSLDMMKQAVKTTTSFVPRTSQGTSFGDNGFLRVKHTADDNNLCGMDTNPLKGMSCALDDSGYRIEAKPVKVCGTSSVLFDVSYPVRVNRID